MHGAAVALVAAALGTVPASAAPPSAPSLLPTGKTYTVTLLTGDVVTVTGKKSGCPEVSVLPAATSGVLSRSCGPDGHVRVVPAKVAPLLGTVLDRDLFDAVQAKLTAQATNHRATRMKSAALLSGRIFDDRGNRMSPSYARKGGVRYRYYLSAALIQGAAERAGSVRRVAAADIEALVIRSVREHLQLSQTIDDHSLVNTHVARVDVQSHQLVIKLAPQPAANRQKEGDDGVLHVAWQKTISPRRREIIVPEGTDPQYARPIRAETRATLITSIARGRRWLDELLADATANAESIASRERCSIRKVNMTVSLAFLAPDLVKAAIDGRLPHGVGVARVADLPAEWSLQHQMLGLPAQ